MRENAKWGPIQQPISSRSNGVLQHATAGSRNGHARTTTRRVSAVFQMAAERGDREGGSALQQ
jgi:hypothetical protein